MGEAIRWIGFVAGLAIVIATLGSIISTIILPRMISSRITYLTWLVVQRGFLAVADRLPRYRRKDQLLAYLGPISLLAALISWMLLFLLGYALLAWPLLDGGDLGAAVRLSGSSLFTLGVASSGQGGPTALEFVAAATGMIVIALQIGYLPTIYGAYNRREMLVTALSARAGAPAWGPEVLIRHHLGRGVATLPALYTAWESWAADIAESHSSYPWLMSFRSPNPLHCWVISLLAVLDSAALYMALSPDQAPPETRQCIRMGFICLRSLASAVGQGVDDDPRPNQPVILGYEAFEHAVELLAGVGFPMERTAAEAWPDFRGWRVNYEAAAYQLADFVVAVPAPWSGTRRHMTYEESFDVLANRPYHRTPGDPEGRAVPRYALRAADIGSEGEADS